MFLRSNFVDGDVCEARQKYAFGQLRQELRRVASGDVDANTFELLLKFSVPRTNIMYTTVTFVA